MDECQHSEFAPEQPQNSAVGITNLCKSYSTGSPVLDKFCMNINKGTIYGLLGSSGCGKTTVVSCIVGVTKWDSGEIRVFGKKLQSGCSGIEGKNVGYMPQDMALYSHLSIKEVAQFYGHVYGMPAPILNERLRFLTKLLELPIKFQQIGDLSGGQKRRASLALALIHSPQLLVLDEPTVGLDPLLRIRIWDYLNHLVHTTQITIIITTHYTEEVKKSHKVGIMRQGHLIYEGQPSQLLETYNCQLLEHAVFQLCKDDENKLLTRNGCAVVSTDLLEYAVGQPKVNTHSKSNNNAVMPMRFWMSLSKIFGLSNILILNTTRSPIFLATALVFLAVQAALTVLVLGGKPQHLSFGIVDYEMNNWTSECSLPKYFSNSCSVTGISCHYINKLKTDNLLNLKSYDTEALALDQVQLGNSWGYLKIPPNYSRHAQELAFAKQFASNESLEGSRIMVKLDHSEFIAAFFMVKRLYILYFEYIQQILKHCGANENEGKMPLFFPQPVYGNTDDNFTDFALPGTIICTVYFFASTMAAVTLISDRKQGTFNRARVAGITLPDIVIGYLIYLGVIVFVQLIITELVLHFIFGFVSLGSVWLCLLVSLMTAFCAVMLGIFMGTLCKDEAGALIICSFMAIALTIEGGVLWPTEGTSKLWQSIVHLVPVALPAQSLRSIIIRGLGLSHFLVWWGLISLVIWFFALMPFCILGYRMLCQ